MIESTMSGIIALTLCIHKSSESILKRAENVGRDELASLGVCFGKFTKSGKFKLHITSVDHLAQYSKVLPSLLVSFLINIFWIVQALD